MKKYFHGHAFLTLAYLVYFLIITIGYIIIGGIFDYLALLLIAFTSFIGCVYHYIVKSNERGGL